MTYGTNNGGKYTPTYTLFFLGYKVIHIIKNNMCITILKIIQNKFGGLKN